MKVGYVRVSTVDQHEDRQVRALEECNCEKMFIDKQSGKNMERLGLKQALEYVREGDTIVVSSFDRLARSTQDLLSIVSTLEEKGVTLISLKESVDTHTSTGRLMLTLIAAIATFERECLLERQREGIAIAKEKGIYKGRKPISIENFDEMYKKYLNREIPSKTALAKTLGISRQTLYTLITEYKTKIQASK